MLIVVVVNSSRFLHSVLQVPGHWVYSWEGMGRSMAHHYCGGHCCLWRQLSGAFHLTFHPGNLLHPHLCHLHLRDLFKARKGKPLFIWHVIYFRDWDCFLDDTSQSLQRPDNSFSSPALSLDLQGTPTHSELWHPEHNSRKSLEPKGGRNACLRQCYRQHNCSRQHN